MKAKARTLIVAGVILAAVSVGLLSQWTSAAPEASSVVAVTANQTVEQPEAYNNMDMHWCNHAERDCNS